MSSEKWVVFGREAVKYDYVGSPRERFEDFWGEEFDSESACADACIRLKREKPLRFWTIYPRKKSERAESV